jgi:hypothetical protein
MSCLFQELFLESPEIFTLFGTKPLSEISMNNASFDKWIEETEPYLENLSEKERQNKLKKLKSYCEENQLPSLWDKWMEWIKLHPSKNFLFLKRPTIYENVFGLCTLNVAEAAWTMQAHYDLFVRELGAPFEPLAMTLEFSNPQSTFWEKIFTNHLLQGILFGFGEKNSYFFNLEIQGKLDHPFPSQLIGIASDSSELPLPYFRSYSVPPNRDPTIAKYEKERNEIKDFLSGKDFVEEVIHRIYLEQEKLVKE